MTESFPYPASQECLVTDVLEEQMVNDEGPELPWWWWGYDVPRVHIRAGDAICPICGAIMDNPLTWMTFDYCPVYLLVCPVCSYEDSIQ